jgi:hypothetical protein
MSSDEPILTPGQQRAATSLRRALRDMSAECPPRLDAARWVAGARRGRPRWAPLRVGLSAAAFGVVAVAGALALAGWPRTVSPSAGPLKHFAGDGVAFDYPAGWRWIAGPLADDYTGGVGPRRYVVAVVGTGSWGFNCRWLVPEGGFESVQQCGEDIWDTAGDTVVVKLEIAHYSLPIPWCAGNDANATLGTVAVRQSGTAYDRIWEIRQPGAEFGSAYNILVEARSDDSAKMAQAEAMVASFRWIGDQTGGVVCDPKPTPKPTLPSASIGGWSRTLDLGYAWSPGSRTSFKPTDDGVVALVTSEKEAEGLTDPKIDFYLYRSTDGLTWTRSQVPLLYSDVMYEDAACWGGRCVVIGHRHVDAIPQGRQAVILVSVDGGPWRETADPLAGVDIKGVAAGANGFVVFGSTVTFGANGVETVVLDAPTMWTSSDGERWTAAVYAPDSPQLTHVSDVTYDSVGGWLAVGDFNGGAAPGGHMPITTSRDGRTWTDETLAHAPGWSDLTGWDGGSSPSICRNAAVRLGGRWVVYCTFFSGDEMNGDLMSVFWLKDGSDVVYADTYGARGNPVTIVSMGNYLLGLKVASDGTTQVVASVDGIYWSAAGAGPSGSGGAMARLGSRLVLLGWTANPKLGAMYVASPTIR